MMLLRAGGADFATDPLLRVMFNQHLCFELPHFLIVMILKRHLLEVPAV